MLNVNFNKWVSISWKRKSTQKQKTFSGSLTISSFPSKSEWGSVFSSNKSTNKLWNWDRRNVLVSSDGLSEVFSFVGSLLTQIFHQIETLWKVNSQMKTIFGKNEEEKPKFEDHYFDFSVFPKQKVNNF